ncbi:MAG: type II toxin-antitoxin system VapC family toxin [Candidatus Hodarchaeales archaeon]|jgi:predicted nucleic acid-binding protein
MMLIYLDTNVFYNAYCPVEDSTIADWLLNQLTEDFLGVTCEWMIIEMFRALKKQVNLDKIDEQGAEVAVDFFLTDIAEMIQKRKLLLVSVTKADIIASRKQIFSKNLYAADALHATIAIDQQVNAFITYDRDFKGELGVMIPTINPSQESFKEKLSELKNKKGRNNK